MDDSRSKGSRSPSDAELVAALQQRGDVMAYETLMKRYQRPVYGFIRRQVGQQELAEELFQETFLRVYEHIDRCDNPGSFSSWTFAIAANLCRNQIRRRVVRQGERATPRLEGQRDPGPDPERAAMTAQVRHQIEEALDQLTDAQREVFILYQYTRLSYDEIAEIIDVPAGTVKSRMNTALARLRAMLELQR